MRRNRNHCFTRDKARNPISSRRDGVSPPCLKTRKLKTERQHVLSTRVKSCSCKISPCVQGPAHGTKSTLQFPDYQRENSSFQSKALFLPTDNPCHSIGSAPKLLLWFFSVINLETPCWAQAATAAPHGLLLTSQTSAGCRHLPS